jgi:hypothetical protein
MPTTESVPTNVATPHHIARLAMTAAVLLSLMMLVALPAIGHAKPQRSVSSAAVSRCLAGHLRLSFVRGRGATGHRYWDFALRNVRPGRCPLQGYPGVGLLNSSGRLVAVNVERVGGPTPNVVVGVGQRAFFTFSYVVSGPCLPHFFSAYGVQVIPPNRTHRLVYYSGRIDICSVSVGGHPVVYPIRPGLAL